MPISNFQVDLILVYFVYGLAFFSMGLAMMLESGRSPLLAEARVLRPLAIFGFIHGIHEWLEMILLKGEWLGLYVSPNFSWVRLALLTLSFASLIAFGLRVLRPQERFKAKDVYIGVGLLGFYGLLVVLSVLLAHPSNFSDWIQHADAMARYTLAVPGAALAAVALFRQASQAKSQERNKLGLSLQVAAFGFGLYSLTQAFVPALDIFPARYLNSDAFLNWTGIPVQFIRALLAGTITISLIRATQFVERERQRHLLSVQQARLDALEQIQRELVEREAMRRELLRHTVIAQEDERARIARELHDETAQILTAFTLNLAALRDILPGKPKVIDLINRLQALSRQMSQGIYHMVHDLRPAQLDDLGLVAALQYLAEEERKRVGLQVDFGVSGPRERLDPLVETVFFRVAQEALTNVARHAQVDRAEIQLLFTPEQVVLRVCDQGVGFDVNEDLLPPHGWGLAGMRERAESIGGQLRIQSAPGQGTMVEVVVPILVLEPSMRGGLA